METDKLYIIIFLGMIGIFIYWYQTQIETTKNKGKSEKVYCAGCKKRMIKRKDKYKDNGNAERERSIQTKRGKKGKSKKKSKSPSSKGRGNGKSKSKKVRFEENDSDDSIPDSLIESRLRRKTNEEEDDESEISIESLDTADRSGASASRRDDDTLDMVDGTIDSDADTIDLD
jgi:hypothetical protein